MTYDPDKTYSFNFTENEISTLENVLETFMEFQKETIPKNIQHERFLSEETKLLKRLYEVSDAYLDEYHAQVDNDMFHDGLADQLKEYKKNHGGV